MPRVPYDHPDTHTMHTRLIHCLPLPLSFSLFVFSSTPNRSIHPSIRPTHITHIALIVSLVSSPPYVFVFAIFLCALNPSSARFASSIASSIASAITSAFAFAFAFSFVFVICALLDVLRYALMGGQCQTGPYFPLCSRLHSENAERGNKMEKTTETV